MAEAIAVPNPSNLGQVREAGRLGGIASGAARRAKREQGKNPTPPTPPASQPEIKPDQKTPPLATALGHGRLALSAEVYAQGWRFVFALLAEKRGQRWLLNDGRGLDPAPGARSTTALLGDTWHGSVFGNPWGS